MRIDSNRVRASAGPLERAVGRPATVGLALSFLATLVHIPAGAQDAASGPATRPARPNVLLILVDDLRPSLGAYGDPLAQTPNLDRLAARGIRFDRAYCNQAVCSPSRINLLTGMRSTTSGVYDLSTGFRDRHPDAVTLPQRFRAHGYRAEALGKVFHVGHGSTDDARSWSVPSWLESPIDYVLVESTGGQLTREEALFANWTDGDPWKQPRGAAWERAPVEDDAYADGRIAREAIRRLRAAAGRDEPFFLAVGFTKPHLPFCAPSAYWDRYDPAEFDLPQVTRPPDGAPPYAPKGARVEIGSYEPVPGGSDPLDDELTRTLIHGYYASISYMDAQVGRVIDELDHLGLAGDTIVVLWGDHGFHLGDHGTWTKHTNYELDTRIPLLIVAPGVSSPGTVNASFVETVDVYPTLVDLAGLPDRDVPQRLDGASLVPLLRDPQATVRDHAYHAYPRGRRLGRAIRTDRYRLVEWRVVGEPAATADYELYDYESGPVETRNLADDRPAVLARLKTILSRHPEPVR